MSEIFRVIPYEEAPCEPVTAVEFASLADARKYAKRKVGGRADTGLRGERYDDGDIHVEAYYQDHHRSSGLWITRRP